MILQASKPIHSRSAWSGNTFHEKLYLLNENKKKAMGLEKNCVFKCSFVICLLNETLLQCTFSAKVYKSQSFLSDHLLQAIVAIQDNLLYVLIL